MVHALLHGGTLLRTQHVLLPRTFCRHKSLTQAIEKGRRAPSNQFPSLEPTTPQKQAASQSYQPRFRYPQSSSDFGKIGHRLAGEENRRSSSSDTDWSPFERSSRSGENWEPHPAEGGKAGRPLWRSWRDKKEYWDKARRPGVYKDSRVQTNWNWALRPKDQPHHQVVLSYTDMGVESLPFTTAASEFIYGHSSVLAAIKANRRRLYKIYLHSRRGTRHELASLIKKLKLLDITSEVGDNYIRAMDRASSGRPHNGIVLEASPLPIPPITTLRAPHREKQRFGVVLDKQSAEELAVNGNEDEYSYNSGGWRFPLVLYVDGVVDEGNLGAIARSAYFLGVDAVITFAYHTAPWSHITLKASAGAAEAIPIFKVAKPHTFLKESIARGWRTYASSAVQPVDKIKAGPPALNGSDTAGSRLVYTMATSGERMAADHCPVAQHPTILMMGSEEAGLKPSLASLANYNVGVPSARYVKEVGVDSLNVSAAASVLCYEMLKKPRAEPAHAPEARIF